jgi:ketosteroid isomerase-like protein
MTHLGKRHHMVGIMLLKIRGGKITHLNEYWNTKPTNHF